MPLLDKSVHTIAGRMPKVITPTAHAVIDYGLAAAFAAVGMAAWRRQQKVAAISSFIVAGAEMALSMITDYPGGVASLISFPTHGKIDAGMAGMVGSMPNLMGFSGEQTSWFFRIQAMSIAAVTGLTDFNAVREARMPRRAA